MTKRELDTSREYPGQREEDARSRRRRRTLGCILPIVVLLVAIGIAVAIIITGDDPEPEEQDERVAVVRTMVAARENHRLDVQARGRVRPAEHVFLLPQVEGRVVEVHPNLAPGGFVAAGEVLLRVEEDDYRLAVQEAESAVTDARADLEMELGQQEVAREEWERFGQRLGAPAGEEQSPLALRAPQLEMAQGRVAAAEAQLERAQLNLRRATLVAPFDAIVLREEASIGQLVSPQTEIAELVGASRLWVEASVRLEQLDFIAIPGFNAAEGSVARVRQDLGQRQVEWTGRVVQLLGDLSPEGLMARILVEVTDPFARAGENDGAEGRQGPLLINASVAVEFAGRQTLELVEIPRSALREGGRTFVVDGNDRLSVRRPEVVWRLPATVLVERGVEDGERVIVSPLATPLDGLRVREEGSDEGAERAAVGQ